MTAAAPSCRDAVAALLRITGETARLIRAPKHWGTSVFLDHTGKQRIAALYDNGRHFAWRVGDRQYLVD